MIGGISFANIHASAFTNCPCLRVLRACRALRYIASLSVFSCRLCKYTRLLVVLPCRLVVLSCRFVAHARCLVVASRDFCALSCSFVVASCGFRVDARRFIAHALDLVCNTLCFCRSSCLLRCVRADDRRDQFIIDVALDRRVRFVELCFQLRCRQTAYVVRLVVELLNHRHVHVAARNGDGNDLCDHLVVL